MMAVRARVHDTSYIIETKPETASVMRTSLSATGLDDGDSAREKTDAPEQQGHTIAGDENRGRDRMPDGKEEQRQREQVEGQIQEGCCHRLQAGPPA